MVQGWLLGRPMPAQAFEVLLAQKLQADKRRT
jgi:EAL domain-containing protein (putative c-di-GMP-specific phosphodiesterase class I)